MADFGGELFGTGINTILSIGLEETAYATAAAADMWSGLPDEFRPGRLDENYEQDGINNLTTMVDQTTIASRYPWVLRGKVLSGVPFAMAGGYISATSDPTLGIFRGTTHGAAGMTNVYQPSWTLTRTFDDETDNLQLLGAVVDSATFNCDLDGPWTYELNGTAQSSADVAATQTAIPSAMLGSWNTTLKIKLDSKTYSATSALTLYGLRNLSFNFTKNLLIRNDFASTPPAAIRRPKHGKTRIGLKITRGYIDDDLWSQILDGGYNSFEIATTDGTRTLTHEFDNCRNAGTSDQSTTTEDETLEVANLSVKDWNCVVSTDGVTYASYV